MLISKVESATSARKTFFSLLDEVTQDSSVVIVKRKDAPNVAIIAESELSSLVETVHLLRSPANHKRLFSALNKSYSRDLDSTDTESAAVKTQEALKDLRRYCEQADEQTSEQTNEQTEEAHTVEVISREQSSEPAR